MHTMNAPTWILRAAEIAARVVPPLLRVVGARRKANDVERRKRDIREEIDRRASERLRKELEEDLR